MNVTAIQLPAGLRRAGRGLRSLGHARLAIALATLIGIAVQALWIPLDSDVSWLLTVCDRVLSGERLYVDILEVNPPASVGLYLPWVWLANHLGCRPEAVVVAAFAAMGVASIAWTLRLASRLRSDMPEWLASALAIAILVLPMGLFAQREHAALLLAIPSLAALALAAENKPLSRLEAIAAGASAGIVVALKPHFALVFVGPLAWAAWRRGSLRPLLPEILAAGAILAIYAAVVLTFMRAYFDYLPMLAATYLRMHERPGALLLGGITFFPALCLALALVLRPRRIPPLAVAWSLGAIGFSAAALLQGKGYANHWFPGAALAMLALAALLLDDRADRARRRLVLTGLAVVALSAIGEAASIRPDPELARAIARVAPPAPTIMALSQQLATGHPVTRNVGGRWVASRAALFTMAGAQFVGLQDPVAAAAYRSDIRSFASEVASRRPDVILVKVSEKPMLMRIPEIAAAMRAYRPAAVTTETEVWLRRP